MIAKAIKEYIDSHGITQSFLCRKTGLNKSKLSLILQNKSNLTVETYKKICDALGVDMEFFNPKDTELSNDVTEESEE